MKTLVLSISLILCVNGYSQKLVDKSYFKTIGLDAKSEKKANFMQLTFLNNDSSKTTKLISLKDSSVWRYESYKRDIQTGIWSVKDENGNISQLDFNFTVDYCDTVIINKSESSPVVTDNFDLNNYSITVSRQIQYPILAISKKISGKVIVKISVDNNGWIGNICIVKRVSNLLDKEVIRVIRSSSNWKPEMFNNQNVKDYFIPIIFTLM